MSESPVYMDRSKDPHLYAPRHAPAPAPVRTQTRARCVCATQKKRRRKERKKRIKKQNQVLLKVPHGHRPTDQQGFSLASLPDLAGCIDSLLTGLEDPQCEIAHMGETSGCASDLAGSFADLPSEFDYVHDPVSCDSMT